MKRNLQWINQPFAHRGLHDARKGIIENTRSAIGAALARGYGIEVDIRPAACGTVMVFHDDRLERLTRASGAFVDKDCVALQEIEFRGTDDKMMSLADLLRLVDEQVPLLVEIKSDWPFAREPVHKFAREVIATLSPYKGDYAVMSFDPAYIRAFRSLAPHIPRGLISERFENTAHWHMLSLRRRLSLRFLLSWPRTRPDFVACDINALPAVAPFLARELLGKKLATWTVRTPEQRQRAQKYCDAMIFEGFEPAKLVDCRQ